MILCSTAWNVERRGGLFEAAAELMGFGFEGVALAAPGGAPDAGSCGERLRRARVRVGAAVAPLVRGRGDGAALEDLASADGEARARAVAALLSSARAARESGTGLLVVPAGEVPVAGARERMARWREAAARAASVGADALAEAAAQRTERAALREGAVMAAARSLHALCRAEPDMTFAVRIPAAPHGIPDLDEVAVLASEVGARNLAFAHDTGRAAVLAALGGPHPEAWLAEHGARCAAVMLSDAAPLEAGLPPGAGGLRWRSVLAELPAGVPRILDLDPRWPVELLLEGLRTVESR